MLFLKAALLGAENLMDEKTTHLLIFGIIAAGLFAGFWWYEKNAVSALSVNANDGSPQPLDLTSNSPAELWTTPYYLSNNTQPVSVMEQNAAQVAPPVTAPSSINGGGFCWPFGCSANGVAGSAPNI
jgi:hypothetical protein